MAKSLGRVVGRSRIELEKRARRMGAEAADLIDEASQGDGITVDSDGLISISLATNPGLQFVSGDLEFLPDTTRGLDKDATGAFIDLATDPGLEFDGGDLTAKVDTTEGLGIDADGIFVKLGTGLSFDVSGNIENTLDISNLVPYTGATQDVDLGDNNFDVGDANIVIAHGEFSIGNVSDTSDNAVNDLQIFSWVSSERGVIWYAGDNNAFLHGTAISALPTNLGPNSFTVGRSSAATGSECIALGNTCTAGSGLRNMAVGRANSAGSGGGNDNFCLGVSNNAGAGNTNFAFGSGNTANSANQTVAVGIGCRAQATFAQSYGVNQRNTTSNSMKLGWNQTGSTTSNLTLTNADTACEKPLRLLVVTDSTRPSAGTAGTIVFNSDDGQLNIDDGTNWTLPDGTTT